MLKGKIAFCTVPHLGGIYSVYTRLQQSLSQQGWQIFCVTVGNEKYDWYGYDAKLADEGYVEIASGETNLKQSVKAFVDWVQKEKIDIVIPMSSKICLSAIPHLPKTTYVVTRCVDITPFAYRLVIPSKERTTKIVVTSKRQWHDLKNKYRIPENKLFLIPNAVDTNYFSGKHDSLKSSFLEVIRLGFVGRLENRQKSIFYLVKITQYLQKKGITWHLDIVGDGPDKKELLRRFEQNKIEKQVKFHGAQPLRNIPAILNKIDILVMPSKFEGFPSALIEAMATGVVPVCSRLKGVTDWIVDDQKTGILCSPNNPKAFAQAIFELATNRTRLISMGKAAQAEIKQRFNIQRFQNNWSQLFSDVINSKSFDIEPLSWSKFRLSPAFHRSLSNRLLFQWIPRSWKDKMRLKLEIFQK